jgi:hypothetical protein
MKILGYLKPNNCIAVVSVCVSTGLTKILPATTTSTGDIKESSIEILFPLQKENVTNQFY